jgi:tripartite-type tricarboxylate transporter receptor subunit TctC
MLNRLAAALLAAALAVPFGAAAQRWPEKPVRIVVPFPAGGPTDIFARQVAKKLSETVKQQFYVENLPGAGGNVGTAAVAKARPDGHSVVFVSASLAISPSLYKSLAYDPQKDLEPIALVGVVPMILVVPRGGAVSVKELIDMAKKAPGKYTYASAGNGSATHLGSEAFKSQVGIDVVHVPYKGTAPAVTDVLAGRHLFIFDYLGPMKSHVEAGRLRILAIAAEQRSKQLPNVPTFAEAGLSGFVASTWNMFLAPAGTPEPIVARFAGLLNNALNDPQVVKQLESLGIEPVSDSTPASSRKLLQNEIARWAQVVETSGATVD